MGRIKVKIFPVIIAGVAALTWGCASYGGLPQSSVDVRTLSSTQIELRRPDVLITADGLRVHGWACRRPRSIVSGATVRIERIDAAGLVVADIEVPLDTRRLSHHPAGCVIYDGAAPWRLAPEETLRVLIFRR
ncbi:MAG: hypothetical protein KF842_00365 [Caulobacter sp.]|nr:hypothetical protein [Caulobacter sp.]